MTTEVYPYDVLYALMGNMSPKKYYPLESGKWSRVLMDLRDRHRQEYPELFYGFSFSTREPADPYSPQVSQVLTTMEMAGLYLSIHNHPKNPRGLMELRPATQRIMLNSARRIPEQYQEAIKQMAKEMEVALSL